MLIAKTFTVNPAIVIFHTGEASLIRTISRAGESVVKGTCLTSFTGIFQKRSQKDLPLIFRAKTEPLSISQIYLLSERFSYKTPSSHRTTLSCEILLFDVEISSALSPNDSYLLLSSCPCPFKTMPLCNKKESPSLQ